MTGVVLVGFGDSLAAPESVFGLHDAGFGVEFFLREGARKAPYHHLPIARMHEIPAPEDDVKDTLRAFRSLLETGHYEAALCLDDTSLALLKRLEIMEPKISVPFANAGGAQLALTLDKRLQIKAAQNAGIEVPPTVFVETSRDMDLIDFFPAILKPACAVNQAERTFVKGPAHFLHTRDEARKVKHDLDFNHPYLAQPLIKGVGEGVFGFASANGIGGFFGHRRVRMMNPHGSGASACRTNPPSQEIKEKVETMMSNAGWQGPFMIELLKGEDGKLWFMELNGRLWGSTALARRCGFDFPVWAVRQALDPSFSPNAPAVIPKMEVRHLGRDILHLFFVLRGPKSEFHKEIWPGRFSALTDVLAPVRPSLYYNYHHDYPLFFLRDALETIRQVVSRPN